MKKPNIDLEMLKAELDTYGIVIIPDLISREEAETAAQRITKVMRRQPDAAELDQHCSNVLDLLEPSDYPLFAKLLAHPVCLELSKHLLGDGFQLTQPGSRWRKPGCPPGPIHITSPINQFPRSGLPIPNTCFVVPFSWNLNDLTPEMGATFYLPFSQFSPRFPSPGMGRKYAVAGEGPAGSLVLHHGGMWHGFGPNLNSNRSRIGFMAGYCASWMNPVAAGYQLMTRKVRDLMPKAVQDLNTRVAED